MTRPSKLAPHEQYIREAAAAGTSQTNIARTLGVARETLQRFLADRKIEIAQPKPVEPSPIEPDDRPSEVEILREQLREARAANRRDTRSSVAEERIVQAIEAAAGRISPSREVYIYPTDPQDPSEKPHHRQLLLLSDFHGGEVVDPEAVNYLNSYSWEIMEQRVDQLINAALSHKKNSPALTGLDVLFVGDQCSGSNHEELAETNEFPLAEQAIKMGYLQADIIRRLAPHYQNVRVGLVVGNHPRLQKKPAAKRVFDNGDFIAGTLMAESLKDLDKVTCTISRSAALLWRIADRLVYLWHGDGVKSTVPGVPWGGVMRRTNEIQAGRREHIDHYILGHYHQPNVVQGGRIILNGSLKGVDEWVQKSFGGGAAPTQLLLTFDEAKSRLTDVRFITPTAGLPA